jgi:hypothetical protein
MGDKGHHLVMEVLDRKGRDLLQLPLIGVEVECLVPSMPCSKSSRAEGARVAGGHHV